MSNSINNICDKDKCLGCSLCEAICPQKAVTISKDSGFYRPIINDRCIGCNICRNNCPVNNKDMIADKCYGTPDKAFAAWALDADAHLISASGGLATLIAGQFIKNGGFAVGVWFNPDTQAVEHRIFDSVDELSAMRGSKYVQSNKQGIYNQVSQLLQEKEGLFIGVPCEVYAMKQYLSFKYSEKMRKMIYIDLLCHGGASPLCFTEHIRKLSFNQKLSNVTFRGGKYDCQICLYKKNKLIYKDGQFLDPYFKLFMRHTLYQQACFECFFAGSKRVGDLTLGDFWGLHESILSKTDVQGINMIMVNSDAGQHLLDMIKDRFIMYERPVLEAIAGNDTLRKATEKEKEYDVFWSLIKEKGFHKAVKSVYGINSNNRFLKMKIKFELKRIFGIFKRNAKK